MSNTLFGMPPIGSLLIILGLCAGSLLLEAISLIKGRRGAKADHYLAICLYMLIIGSLPLWKIKLRLPFSQRHTMITVVTGENGNYVFDVDGGHRYREVVYSLKYGQGFRAGALSFDYQFAGTMEVPSEAVGRKSVLADVYTINYQVARGKEETLRLTYKGGRQVVLERPEMTVIFDQKSVDARL